MSEDEMMEKWRCDMRSQLEYCAEKLKEKGIFTEVEDTLKHLKEVSDIVPGDPEEVKILQESARDRVQEMFKRESNRLEKQLDEGYAQFYKCKLQEDEVINAYKNNTIKAVTYANKILKDAEIATALDKLKADESIQKQIGGDHYSKLKIQPAEYSTLNNLGFLEGSVVKYVTRYKDKNGKQDLEKAIHCLEILIKLRYDNA